MKKLREKKTEIQRKNGVTACRNAHHSRKVKKCWYALCPPNKVAPTFWPPAALMPSGAKVVPGKGPPLGILDLCVTTLTPVRASRSSALLGLAIFTFVFVFPTSPAFLVSVSIIWKPNSDSFDVRERQGSMAGDS